MTLNKYLLMYLNVIPSKNNEEKQLYKPTNNNNIANKLNEDREQQSVL